MKGGEKLTIGERIGCLRKELKMSRRVFGEKLGVSESVIVNIEYDRLKRPEQKESLYKLICKEYRVNETWLRTGEGEMFVPLSRDEQIEEFIGDMLREESNSFKKRLISALAKLSEAEWELLEDKMKEIVLGEDNED